VNSVGWLSAVFAKQKLLHTSFLLFMRNLSRAENFHTEKPLDRAAFTHRRRERFYMQKLLQRAAVTHRRICTQKLLHREGFTPSSFYTQTPLHTETLTQRTFYTQMRLHKEKAFTRRRNCSTENPLRRAVFTRRSFLQVPTQRNLYTQELLLTGVFTCRLLCTQKFLQSAAFTHRIC